MSIFVRFNRGREVFSPRLYPVCGPSSAKKTRPVASASGAAIALRFALESAQTERLARLERVAVVCCLFLSLAPLSAIGCRSFARARLQWCDNHSAAVTSLTSRLQAAERHSARNSLRDTVIERGLGESRERDETLTRVPVPRASSRPATNLREGVPLFCDASRGGIASATASKHRFGSTARFERHVISAECPPNGT